MFCGLFGFGLSCSFSLIALDFMQFHPLEIGKTMKCGHTHSVIPELFGLVWSIGSSTGWLSVWTEVTVGTNSVVECLHIRICFEDGFTVGCGCSDQLAL